MIKITNLLDRLLQHHDIALIEDGKRKRLCELKRQQAFIQYFIHKAESYYSYVFGDSMLSVSDESYDLTQTMFIFDQMLEMSDNNTLEINSILGDEYAAANQ